MNLIIKRQRFNAYRELNILCNEQGKEITRESNVCKSVKYGSKTYKYKGVECNVIKWERISAKEN